LEVADVPEPAVRAGGLLVRTAASLISAGTERGKIELARKSLIEKARARPEAVRQVLENVRREGIAATYRRVLTKLDRLTPIGYSAAGTVTAIGTGVTRFRVGDRVSVGGAGYANHAEFLWVPQNLAVPLPGDVSFLEGSFATIASIALHGLRLGPAGMGDNVAIVGLGLLGQLAARLAHAAGCRVVGCDVRTERVELAKRVGVAACGPDEFPGLMGTLTDGFGADLVLITAAAKSSEPIRLAGEVARDRAKVVVVGMTGLEIPRELYYRKELSVVVSRSYGPGRYDRHYEDKGIDYPIGYVRWTEGRNMAAVLQLIAARRLVVNDLVSHRYPVADAARAYEELLRDDSPAMAVALEYPERVRLPPSNTDAGKTGATRGGSPVAVRATRRSSDALGIGVIGIGSFASNVLIPCIKRVGGSRLVAVASATGLSAEDGLRRHGFLRALPDAATVIGDPDVDAVIIATPHDLHAELALLALEAGKAVFVEKPAAINWEQLGSLREAVTPAAPLFVGYNRRFSPHTQFVQNELKNRTGAAVISVRVNAGRLPAESSLHDPEVGGGRLIGEGCHFIDLCVALVGTPPQNVRAVGIGAHDPDAALLDNFLIVMEFPDSSVASVLYTSKGDLRLPKERIEVFCDGWAAVIDNFDESTVLRDDKKRRYKAKASKGHKEEIAEFVAAVREGKPMPIALDELWATSAATLAARDSLLASGERVGLS